MRLRRTIRRVSAPSSQDRTLQAVQVGVRRGQCEGFHGRLGKTPSLSATGLLVRDKLWHSANPNRCSHKKDHWRSRKASWDHLELGTAKNHSCLPPRL